MVDLSVLLTEVMVFGCILLCCLVPTLLRNRHYKG